MPLQHYLSFTPNNSNFFASRWWWWFLSEDCCFVCGSYKKHHISSCDYVEDFVVFYQPYQRGHQKCSSVFLFVQVSAFELPMMTKKEQVQYITKNTMTTSDRNSNLWCNLLHRFPSVTSHNLSHTLDICFICWRWWVTTTQIINNLMPVIYLRLFHCSVTYSCCNMVNVSAGDIWSKT